MGHGQRRGRVLEKKKGTIEMRLYDIDKLKAEIEARFNDNLEAEEKSGAGIFGAAAKEDYDILALIENMDELNDEKVL